MPLRCVCPNGHVLLVKDELAGGTGVCPTCRTEFAIPPIAARTTPEAAPPRVGQGEAIEWRLAWPDGQQFGPTVATVFAQWITAGRVPPDALVWRTGWSEWRNASDAAGDLPAPLPDPEGEAGESETALAANLPPPTLSSAGQASPPMVTSRGDRQKPAGGAYTQRRRREARRRRLYAVGLAIVCLALTTMLMVLMFHGPPESVPVVP